MKRAIIGVAGVCLWHTVHPQQPEDFQVFLEDKWHLDSGQVIAGISLIDKMTMEKPETLLKAAPAGGTIVDDEPRRLRHQFRGSIHLLVYPRTNLRERIQPHFLLEANGLTNYYYLKAGGGITDRKTGLSCGVFGGSYMRRVDDYTAFKYRAKYFEHAELWGAYFFKDFPEASAFGSYAFEKKEMFYSRVLATWKIGKTLDLPKGLEDFRLQMEHETFLGTGGGVSYQVVWEEFALGVSFSYLVPDRGEQRRQRIINNDTLGEGWGAGISLNWH